MIVRTDAVIVSTMKYRESSRILHLYTREFGKMSVLAKGARDTRSRLGSSLNLLNHVTAVIYRKEHRDLQLLTQCDLVNSFRHISDDLERMAPAMAVVELLKFCTPHEEENAPLFSLLISTLSAIDRATKNAGNALYIFEMRLLEIMGFRPNFHTCVHCGREVGEAMATEVPSRLHVSRGGVLCPACSAALPAGSVLSSAAIHILQRMQEIQDVESVTRITLSPPMKQEISAALRQVLQEHIEGLRSLKSETVFSSFM